MTTTYKRLVFKDGFSFRSSSTRRTAPESRLSFPNSRAKNGRRECRMVASGGGIVGDGERDSKSARNLLKNTISKRPTGMTCDKCDKTTHTTENCPYFKKTREKHIDAHCGRGTASGANGKCKSIIRRGRVIKQPPDGSCLFHSLSYGLKDGSRAGTLRRQICTFIQNNPKLKISDTPLHDWVKWDSRTSVSAYANRMAIGGWGGGIEMAATAKLKNVTIEVYERCSGGFKRISCFESPGSKDVVRVVYQGGVHYDALV